MKTYLLRTKLSMKEYNCRKWFIMSDYVRDIEVSAENVRSALSAYAEIVSDKYGIDISRSALKNKSAMYCDFKDGSTKQVGYVITGSTDFNDDNRRWVKQYIDCWVEVKEIAFCDEVA